jgi:hypothetical protein
MTHGIGCALPTHEPKMKWIRVLGNCPDRRRVGYRLAFRPCLDRRRGLRPETQTVLVGLSWHRSAPCRLIQLRNSGPSYFRTVLFLIRAVPFHSPASLSTSERGQDHASHWYRVRGGVDRSVRRLTDWPDLCPHTVYTDQYARAAATRASSGASPDASPRTACAPAVSGRDRFRTLVWLRAGAESLPGGNLHRPRGVRVAAIVDCL